MSIKLRLPDTPAMRYERMLAAAVFALMCLVLAAQFGAMALQVSGELHAPTPAAEHQHNLRVLSFVLASASLSVLACALVVFAAIKVNFFQGERGKRFYFGSRRFGLGLVRLSLVLAALWLVAQALLPS